ncbi:unnamed protein product [Caenorhabditis bovis]|uniref:Uncharacterized protein n=1 Tax=Caenorhabditis bovis TaxID=2654633 RepID=A0A8S1EJ82_9PELO|nr:unnamed protein product [Caenorhabditis bovis]
MEVEYADNVNSNPCTPQRAQLFDPTQPSTSGMSSTTSTPRMMPNRVIDPETPVANQGGFYAHFPPNSSYMPGTPNRTSSRMSNNGIASSPFRPQPQNMAVPANERVQQLREAAIGKQNYMQQWMGSGYNMPSPQHSNRPPSMMGSTISTMSHMSDLSRFSIGGMSTLSVNTEIANYSWPQNPHQAPHILSKVSGSSSVENQDPMKQRRRMSINEIIMNLRSSDSMNKMLSLRELIPAAEQNQLEMSLKKTDLRDLIYTLFENLLPRENEDEKVVEATLYVLYHAVLYPSKTRICLKIFDTLNLEIMGRISREKSGEIGSQNVEFRFENPNGIFSIIMYRASQMESRYCTKAWMLLTHLLCNTSFKRRFIAAKYARPGDGNKPLRDEVTRFAVESLKKDLKSKPKGFAVSIIRNLSQANPEILQLAMSLDVVKIFLNIMKEETIHEDLLWSTALALSSFFSDSRNGEYFIRLGGAQIVCGLLSHGSSRLLHELLACMAKVADLPAIKEHNMAEPIHSVVQLLGSFDPTIVERSTAVLMNIGLHNKSNKAILLQCGVTNHVFAVLRMSDQYLQLATNPQQCEAIRIQIGNIYENCLRILNNVTIMSQSDSREVYTEACKMISINVDSAATFLNFICIGKRYCRKLAITILKRVIEIIPSYAERFVDLHATTNERLPMLLLKRIWESLKQWRQLSKELMMNSGPSAEIEKKRKDHEGIVSRSSCLLRTLCLTSNPRFMKDVKDAMLNAGANPFLFLSHEINDPMLSDWLNFIWEVCNTQESLTEKLLLKLMAAANLHHSSFLHELHERRPNPMIRTAIRNMIQLADQQGTTP